MRRWMSSSRRSARPHPTGNRWGSCAASGRNHAGWKSSRPALADRDRLALPAQGRASACSFASGGKANRRRSSRSPTGRSSALPAISTNDDAGEAPQRHRRGDRPRARGLHLGRTIRRTRVIGVRQGPTSWTHDLRLRYLPREHGHAARPGLAQAIRDQSDSSSKRPAASAPSSSDGRQTQRPPPTRERREALTRVIPYQR